MYNFIINPAARSGLGRKTWKKVEKILLKQKIEYRVFYTRGQKDAGRIARKVTSGPDPVKLVLIGGDGTLHEMVSGIQNWENVSVGYIPVGSGNDFARGMGWKRSAKRQLENILRPDENWQVDCGKAQTELGGGRFMVSAGIGYDAGVCWLVNHSRLKKILNRLRLGKMTYLILGVYQLFASKRFRGELELDGRCKVFLRDILFCSVHNLPYEGGGVPFCPKADPMDGKMDVCVVSRVPKRKLPVLLLQALKGQHIKYRGVRVYRCKEIKIHARTPQYFHMDGEVIGKVRKVKIRTEKGKVHML